MDKHALQNRNGVVKTIAEWETEVIEEEEVIEEVVEEDEIEEKPKTKKKK
uniref:Uncharacterized protein n=1 Tax=viral metagenome TaxID=1070528 RepID=A0A6H1ZJB2_9ZZZZ